MICCAYDATRSRGDMPKVCLSLLFVGLQIVAVARDTKVVLLISLKPNNQLR